MSFCDDAHKMAARAGLFQLLAQSGPRLDEAWRLYAAARRLGDETQAKQWNREWLRARKAHEGLLHQLKPFVREWLGVRYLVQRSCIYLYMSDEYMRALGQETPGW